MSLFMFLFLFLIPFVKKDADPYLSSKEACDYLMKNHEVKNRILCSKFFSRGVRYYTNMNVAVMDYPGKNFFSPHPIPFYNNDTQIRDFLRSQIVTFAVLKKSAIEDIERITGKEMKFKVLKIVGNEYVLKIEPAGNPTE